MKPHHHRTLVSGFEAVFHDPRPQPARGAEFSDFLKKMVVDIEEERQAAGKLVNLKPRLERRLHVRDPIGEGECEFLHRGRTGFADVITGDRNSIPVWDFAAGEIEYISNYPHRAARWINVGAAGNVLFENVILDSTAKFVPADTALLSHCQVEREQNRGCGIDRHRGRDTIER